MRRPPTAAVGRARHRGDLVEHEGSAMKGRMDETKEEKRGRKCRAEEPLFKSSL
jgi:hypothetical protein